MTNDDWTPVTEGLPTLYRQVIVQYYDGDMDVAVLMSGERWSRRGKRIGGVVAWMPLPEPWRGEGREEA